MNDYSGLKRAVTYLSPSTYQALRKTAFDNERSISTELKTLVEENCKETDMTHTETHMSMAMSHLRKVTGPVTGENRQRLQDYVDAIETELARIKSDRGLK